MTSDFRWGTLIVASVRRLRDSGACAVPFVDFEVIPPLDGSPDGIFVWFICEHAVSKDLFNATELLNVTRRLKVIAVGDGFPKAAAETLRSAVTSKPEIEQGGGRFNFFR
jgi:hypothetical protein